MESFQAFSQRQSLRRPLKVLVTGAASGIGQAQAQAFLEAGHQVLAVDRAPMDWAEGQDQVRTCQLDLSQAEAQTVIAELLADWGALDVLCNTAGILDDYLPLAESSHELWQEVFRTNVDSLFYVTQAALPYLLAAPSSRVINMASIAGLTAGGGGIAYTAAKHAIVGFTKQLAYDYASQGLRANAIAPGAVATPMNAKDFQDDAEMAQWVADQTPVKRWAGPEEVASLTLFLASDGADYIQGAVLPVDGGWLIR
ncbi:3-oxoacyl-ACP reductase [Aerococcus sanguinicola]|uniref:3-ketoacyl-ACP reductase n=1 Tax=Aerococcus sanguinicola TaxID=119206 RepID=A0A0X8FAR5_9LACT|nr:MULTISPECIES: 3-oxoacyl-ACP reductase [Aerococcus]AMB93899.1 3-ketoacyl-ACP reductase [Aerococcus sanguinicola]MDK7050528.1 3-oxoacyl-ACP reductase [Aerococcus sanguinicola]OFT97137.1 NAD(P)-dependent dehydrogenase [Aerococcus sp. HMSC23C02]PKZ21150.1 3-oxoacyl-ACP reductase [Aerococcus sanguinicola]